jgi:hypothetical protein
MEIKIEAGLDCLRGLCLGGSFRPGRGSRSLGQEHKLSDLRSTFEGGVTY